jgi:hypothetical protein
MQQVGPTCSQSKRARIHLPGYSWAHIKQVLQPLVALGQLQEQQVVEVFGQAAYRRAPPTENPAYLIDNGLQRRVRLVMLDPTAAHKLNLPGGHEGGKPLAPVRSVQSVQIARGGHAQWRQRTHPPHRRRLVLVPTHQIRRFRPHETTVCIRLCVSNESCMRIECHSTAVTSHRRCGSSTQCRRASSPNASRTDVRIRDTSRPK